MNYNNLDTEFLTAFIFFFWNMIFGFGILSIAMWFLKQMFNSFQR